MGCGRPRPFCMSAIFGRHFRFCPISRTHGKRADALRPLRIGNPSKWKRPSVGLSGRERAIIKRGQRKRQFFFKGVSRSPGHLVAVKGYLFLRLERSGPGRIFPGSIRKVPAGRGPPDRWITFPLIYLGCLTGQMLFYDHPAE